MKKKLINSNNIYIVGDIGNTDTKIFLLNHKFDKTRKIFLKTRLISNIYMNKNLKILKNKSIKLGLFSSVVPSAYKQLSNFFKKIYGISCSELKNNKFSKLVNLK